MINKINEFSTKSESHWVELFALLSLDGIADVYDLIGLSFVDRNEFLSSLRGCIRKMRLDIDTPQNVPSTQSFYALHNSMLSCLHDKLPRNVYDRFALWQNTAFLGTHSEQPQVSAWEIVLRQLKRRDLWPSALAVSEMERLTSEFVSVNRTRRADWNRRMLDIKQRTLSDWDVEIYARHGWNHYSELNDPYTSASLMSSNYGALAVLKNAQHRLTAESLESLRSAGDAILKQLDIWMPGKLISVADLVEGL